MDDICGARAAGQACKVFVSLRTLAVSRNAARGGRSSLEHQTCSRGGPELKHIIDLWAFSTCMFASAVA